jgi:hypothetical protein
LAAHSFTTSETWWVSDGNNTASALPEYRPRQSVHYGAADSPVSTASLPTMTDSKEMKSLCIITICGQAGQTLPA